MGNGGSVSPPNTVIPSDAEFAAFCAAWPGDLSRGIPGGIPEAWWTGWLANKLTDEKRFPRDWRRVLELAFRGDWLNGHPKARLLQKKSPGDPTPANGRSVPQARFEISRELADVQARLDACYESGIAGDAGDAEQEKKLRAALAALPTESSPNVQTKHD